MAPLSHVGLHVVFVAAVAEEHRVPDPVVQLDPRDALLDQVAVLRDAAAGSPAVGERSHLAGAVVPHGSRPELTFSDVGRFHGTNFSMLQPFYNCLVD